MRWVFDVLLGTLLLSSTAVAQTQNTDSQVQVNDNLYGVTPASKLFVTPDGGSRTTLGAALAAGGGGCTSNCTFGGTTTANTLHTTSITGSPSIATPTLTGTTTTAGITDSSGITTPTLGTTAGINDTSAGGGSSVPGGGLGITTTGDLSSNQTVTNWASATTDHKSQYLTTALTFSGTATKVWENFGTNVLLTGTTTGEINVIHSIFHLASGSTAANAEAAELQIINDGGTATGTLQSALAIAINNSGTIPLLIGYQTSFTNNGTINEYRGLSCNGPSGTEPLAYYCVKNGDSNAVISSLGAITSGTVSPIGNTMLSVKSTGTTSATYSQINQNSAGTTTWRVNDNGEALIGTLLQVGTVGGSLPYVQINGTTAGSVKLVSSTQNIGANYSLTLPATQNDIIATVGASQTFSNVNTFSNALNITGLLRQGGAISYSSTAPTIGSGFGTSPTVSGANGTSFFIVNVGSGGTANTGVITMPTGTTGWVCNAIDRTNPGASNTVAVPTSSTSVTLNNYSRTTGAFTAWTAGDQVWVTCAGG